MPDSISKRVYSWTRTNSIFAHGGPWPAISLSCCCHKMTLLSSTAELLRRRGCLALAVIAACAVASGQQSPDADSALGRTRERVLADLERMPRYTCVQTITRQYYVRKSKAPSCAALIADHGKS